MQTVAAEKSFEIKNLDPPDADAALAVINRFTRRPVTADEVYIGRAELANDQIDKSGERFPPAYLERFAATIAGAPVLEAHDKKRSGVGRWFAASVQKDGGTARLITDFYLDARSDLARRVDLGIASEVSIGVMVPKLARTCDLCSKPYDGACEHHVLEEYAGKTCTLTYGGDVRRVRAIEGSFVGVGCQHGAQVIRSKVWAPGGLWVENDAGLTEPEPNPEPQGEAMEKAELEARIKALEVENEALKGVRDRYEKDAAAAAEEHGKAFHTYLMGEITKAYGVLKRDPAAMVKLLERADVETLQEHRTGLLAEIDEKFPPTSVSKQLGEGGDMPPADGKKPPQPFDPLASLRGDF